MMVDCALNNTTTTSSTAWHPPKKHEHINVNLLIKYAMILFSTFPHVPEIKRVKGDGRLSLLLLLLVLEFQISATTPSGRLIRVFHTVLLSILNPAFNPR